MSHMLQNVCNDTSSPDDEMWEKLYSKQLDNLQGRAFNTFLDNLVKFDLPRNKIPTLIEISARLQDVTGWQVIPVTGLIKHDEYYSLLAEKKFPCTIFIRKEHEENISKDPDIFHEVFGHCTMLFSPDYAIFLQEYAKFALTVKTQDQPLFARVLWFTTETGLINTDEGLRIYGSSILSSFTESQYCLQDKGPIRKPFDLVSIFREPYRADMLQKVYYVVNDCKQVYSLLDNIQVLYQALATARELGELPALFPVDYNKYTNIGHCVPDREFELS